MRLGPIIRDGHTLGVTLIATDITERRRLEQEILDVSERERRRIGLDLHDGLGQTLTGTSLICRGLSSRLTERGAEEARDVMRIGSLIQDAIAQTRAIARGLYPLALDTQGLRGALESLASSVDGIPGVSCSVTGEATADAFTTLEATHLFRIAQEAVINALRHASARHLTIRIDAGPQGRGLSVADDGTGLPPGHDKEGLGFRLMRYRAGIIGGTFSIRRGDPGGTVIQCSL
jgi:signal transduction histidine kinase